MDSAAVALAGFRKNGVPEADMSKTMKVTALDLDQTRRNLYRLRISRHEWKAIEPGVRRVYRQCRKRMKRAVGHSDDDAYHEWRIRIKSRVDRGTMKGYEMEQVPTRGWVPRFLE